MARVKQIFPRENALGMGDSGRIYVGELEIDPDQVQVLKNGKEASSPPRVQAPPHPGP